MYALTKNYQRTSQSYSLGPRPHRRLNVRTCPTVVNRNTHYGLKPVNGASHTAVDVALVPRLLWGTHQKQTVEVACGPLGSGRACAGRPDAQGTLRGTFPEAGCNSTGCAGFDPYVDGHADAASLADHLLSLPDEPVLNSLNSNVGGISTLRNLATSSDRNKAPVLDVTGPRSRKLWRIIDAPSPKISLSRAHVATDNHLVFRQLLLGVNTNLLNMMPAKVPRAGHTSAPLSS